MRSFPNLIPGIAIILLGIGLLMDRLGYWEFSIGRILHNWWPLALVVIGVWIFFDRPRVERKTGQIDKQD